MTVAATEQRRGVYQLPRRCWVLVDADGREHESFDHYPAESAAADYADEMYRPQQRPEACWIAVCNECGGSLDYDGEHDEGHGRDQNEILAAADAAEWTVTDDQVRCFECGPVVEDDEDGEPAENPVPMQERSDP